MFQCIIQLTDTTYLTVYPAATAAVNKYLSFPEDVDSFTNAASNSSHRVVNRCLSSGGEFPRWAGYSQSRSRPSNLYFFRRVKVESMNCFLFADVLTIAENNPDNYAIM